MRIVTFNVWHRFGDHEARARAVNAVLEAAAPDVVCLQECWTEPTTDTSQAVQVGEALGLAHHVDGHRVEHEGFTFGNAIVSRWPIERHETRPLTPHPDYEEHRNVIGARIQTPVGAVHVFTAHLNFLLEQSAVRQAQIRDIARMVLDWRTQPTAIADVVTGDFNAEPDSDEIRQLVGKADLGLPLSLLDSWALAGEGHGVTWSAANPNTLQSFEPDRRIDYILTGHPRDHGGRGAVRSVSLVGTAPVDGVWASDHSGVVAELQV